MFSSFHEMLRRQHGCRMDVAGKGGCPGEEASGPAETSRARSHRGPARFAVSASHMQRGNLTAPPQTHRNSALVSHRE